MVALIIRDATNTPRTITELRIRDAGNVQRTITELWIRDVNNVSRLVFNPSGSATLAVVISPTEVMGSSSGTGTATTDVATATPSSGTAPYTHAWTLDTYTGGTPPTIGTPANAATTFTLTGMDPSGIYGAQFTDTVTDAVGNTATATVQAFFADNG